MDTIIAPASDSYLKNPDQCQAAPGGGIRISGPMAGKIYAVTDPGRALISGKCVDIGKFKGPVLRGLAARAPYFHNGSAATLLDVVNFYNARFSIGLTEQQKQDLAEFLGSL